MWSSFTSHFRFALETLVQTYLDSAVAQGITFTTLAGADAATLDCYIEFHADRMMETPDLAGHPRWKAQDVRTSSHLDTDPHLEWIFLALSPAGEWLGTSVLVCYGDMAYNELTAIHPQGRGQKLALALKLQAIQAAQQAGLTFMRTNNHSQNAPMLAVNKRLGFQRKSGAFELHLRF